MSRNVVVLLKSDDGRSLVRSKCRAAGLRLGLLEELIEEELDQQGKMRKAGLWEEFDRIFDESAGDNE